MHFAYSGTIKTHACTRAQSKIHSPTEKFGLRIGKFGIGGMEAMHLWSIQ